MVFSVTALPVEWQGCFMYLVSEGAVKLFLHVFLKELVFWCNGCARMEDKWTPW